MNDLSKLLGEPLRRPESFRADRALCDESCTYHLDFNQAIIRRIKPKDPVQPIAYFELIIETTKPRETAGEYITFEPEIDALIEPEAPVVQSVAPQPVAMVLPSTQHDAMPEEDWIDIEPDAHVPAYGEGYGPVAEISKPPKRPKLSWLKTALSSVVVVAIALILYPLYPGVRYHAQKFVSQSIEHTNALASAPATVSADNNEVVIPKIGVRTKILEAPTLAILDHAEGVWRQTGDASSNLVLAGHRWKYLPPNSSTLYNLGQLTKGDSIIVDWYGTRLIYAVTSIETVTAKQVGILDQDGTQRLTIYTCSDKRESRRIVVHAVVVP